jgi:hypothetical protein
MLWHTHSTVADVDLRLAIGRRLTGDQFAASPEGAFVAPFGSLLRSSGFYAAAGLPLPCRLQI